MLVNVFLQSMHALLEREHACMAGMHGSTQDRSKPRIQHAHVAAGSMLSEECTAALNLQVRFFSSASAFEFASVYLIQLSADAIAWRHLRRMLAAVVLRTRQVSRT